MATTMTDPRESTVFPEVGEPGRPQLRVTRHGYDPADVHALLASARRLHEEIELERMAHDARSLVADDLGLQAEPEEDRMFSRFMSDDIADEPSREWVIGRA